MHTTNTHSHLGQHAIVIGGSIAGLTTARVLTDFFDRVTVIERDRLPEAVAFRRGVPQAHHAHVLLLKGLQVLESLFPHLSQELIAAGAVRANVGSDFAFWLKGAWRGPAYESSLVLTACSRPLVEGTIYRRVATHPRIQFLQECEVMGLCIDDGRQRATGVRIRPRSERTEPAQELHADLIVDAGGRHSRAPEWLAALNFPLPREITISAHPGYASRIYQRPQHFADSWKALYIMPEAPHQRRGAVALPMEGNRWHVTLIGMDGDHPPTDEDGFLAFVRSLPSPRLYETLQQARPLTEPVGFRNAENRLRQYDKLSRYLENFLLCGDSVYALNPVYGQGMTVAALGAQTLNLRLRRQQQSSSGLTGLAPAFQKDLGNVIAGAWQMATSQDQRWASTEGTGELDRATRLMQSYFDRVQETMVHNHHVAEAFFKVMQMVAPPTVLFHPAILGRVLWSSWQKRRKPRQSTVEDAVYQNA